MIATRHAPWSSVTQSVISRQGSRMARFRFARAMFVGAQAVRAMFSLNSRLLPAGRMQG
jgi:hypothetical protein